jgi:hypothetical protein
MTIMSFAGWSAILGGALALGGCAVTRLQAPAVTPEAIELSDIQLDQQRFKVRLHVQNPNDRSLPIKSVSCNLQVEGVDVGTGESTELFTVPCPWRPGIRHDGHHEFRRERAGPSQAIVSPRASARISFVRLGESRPSAHPADSVRQIWPA